MKVLAPFVVALLLLIGTTNGATLKADTDYAVIIGGDLYLITFAANGTARMRPGPSLLMAGAVPDDPDDPDDPPTGDTYADRLTAGARAITEPTIAVAVARAHSLVSSMIGRGSFVDSRGRIETLRVSQALEQAINIVLDESAKPNQWQRLSATVIEEIERRNRSVPNHATPAGYIATLDESAAAIAKAGSNAAIDWDRLFRIIELLLTFFERFR